jgi:hypothetical protein
MRKQSLQHDARLLVLTLALEQAVHADDWRGIGEALAARDTLLLEPLSLDESSHQEIAAIEERILKTLRHRLTETRVEMRNLSTALRIAAPYAKPIAHSALSLAS